MSSQRVHRQFLGMWRHISLLKQAYGLVLQGLRANTPQKRAKVDLKFHFTRSTLMQNVSLHRAALYLSRTLLYWTLSTSGAHRLTAVVFR